MGLGPQERESCQSPINVRAALSLFLLLAGCEQKQSEKNPSPKLLSPPSLTKVLRPVPEKASPAAKDLLPTSRPQDSTVNLNEDSFDAMAATYAEDGDIEAGMAFFSKSPIFSSYGIYLTMFARRLAASDPIKGYNWLIGLESNELKGAALISFARALFDVDPLLAQKLGSKDKLSRDSINLNRGTALAMAKKSPEGAVKFLENLYAQDRKPLLSSVGSLISSGLLDPAHVLKLSIDYPESMTPETLGKNLFQAWKNNSTPNSGLPSFSDKLARRTGMWDTFTKEYIQHDYVAASEWASALPQGTVRDEVSFALAREISSNFPTDSLRWSLSIQNPEQRRIAVEMVIGSARVHDLENARKAIEGAQISEGERQKFLKHFSGLGNKN